MLESGPATPPASRYDLYSEIGAGGMATVHLARFLGPSGFAKVVAVKRLHRHNAVDPEFVSMFVDEARLAARIDHPNVVSTLDIVQGDEELLLVMEYVHGVSLHALMRRSRGSEEPLPAAIITALLGGALQGLHAAHEALDERGQPLGIVHRDISPQNLLVGADGVCRVLDFGIALAETRSHQTQDGRIKGKLSYMAPEQLEGERCDRRADIFATGVVLWEALTGRRLFQGKHVGEIVGRVLAGDVPPPSEAGASTNALDAVTAKALALDLDVRFPSALAMARALESAVMPATPLAVADFLRERWGEELTTREQLVSGMTQSVHAPVVSLATETYGDEAGPEVTRATKITPVPSPTDSVTTSVVTVSAQEEAVEGSTQPAGHRWALGIIAALCVAVGVAAGLMLQGKNVAPTPASSGLVPRDTPAPSVARNDVEVPVTTASPVTKRTMPSAQPKSAPTRPRAPRPATSAPPPASCKPPYWVDADGEKHFRKECF